ncbi:MULTISPECIES: ABC transporter permease [unclassified Virgibacillus]|uniref:ABC transporter permease n=1 Tax=unclassified Virgibacillus TaxID=2620237 RepID=UPI0024DDFBE1|nr:ABC transporter permease [Virgibacillus sp. LDC-1]
MVFIKHLILFVKQYSMQLQRKWLSLPLILLFPILLIAMGTLIIATFFSPQEKEPIRVGLVDLDQSKETKMVVQLIESASQLGSYLDIESMDALESNEQLTQNTLSASIVFPENFVQNLYEGDKVKIHVLGNPQQPTNSQLIKSLIDSVTRHITASQANILTINYYARELGMPKDERDTLLFEQFKEFVFYAMGKDSVVSEETIINQTTSSPVLYFSMASWFITLTVWTFSLFNLLYQEGSVLLRQRMKLYGVTQIQQVIARIIVTIGTVMILFSLSLFFIHYFLKLDLVVNDYIRISGIIFLYILIALKLLALIELLIRSAKFRILLQIMFITFSLFFSGAIIPTIYFPIQFQAVIEGIYAKHAFYWLQEIVLNDRISVVWQPLLLTLIVSTCMLIAASIWKERVS